MTVDENDFPRALHTLGLTVRLRRIADAVIHDARRLYRELGIDIEPNWHVVLLLIERHPGIGVAEIARRLGMTHPSVSTLVGQVAGRGYLNVADDPTDGRRRAVTLTRKAKRMMPKLRRIWTAGGAAIAAAIQATGLDVLATVGALEDAFARHPWGDTTRRLLEKDVGRNEF